MFLETFVLVWVKERLSGYAKIAEKMRAMIECTVFPSHDGGNWCVWGVPPEVEAELRRRFFMGQRVALTVEPQPAAASAESDSDHSSG